MIAKTRYLLVQLMMLAGAAGCTVGPDYHPPESRLPECWSTSQPAEATSRPAEVAEWWRLFGDPTLNGLVERAVRSNLDLRIAQARVRQARAERTVAAADLWPQADVSAAYSYQGRSLNRKPGKPGDSAGRQFRDTLVSEADDDVLDGSFEPSGYAADVMGETLSNTLTRRGKDNQAPRAQSLFEAGFDASWELDVFGGVRRSVEAAEAQIGAAREGYRDVLVTLLFEVARNYVEARGYQQRITIARQNIEIQEKTLRLTRSLYEGGLASELDVVRAQAQLSSTRSQVSVLETSFRQAVHRLSLLAGDFPDATLAELSKEGPVPAAPPEIPLGLPSDLLRRRPDIRRGERQLAAATAHIGVAIADLYPRFSLTGSFGSKTYDVRHLLDGRSLVWSVGPAVDWPIADAGRIRANIGVKNAIQQQALAQYELTVLRAVMEVEDALTAYRNERVRYQDLVDFVDASSRAVSLANALYNEGVSDFMDVVDAERSLYISQDELVRSRTNTTLHAIAVFKALGGGWEAGVEHGSSEQQ